MATADNSVFAGGRAPIRPLVGSSATDQTPSGDSANQRTAIFSLAAALYILRPVPGGGGA